MGSISGWETKVPYVMWYSLKKKNHDFLEMFHIYLQVVLSCSSSTFTFMSVFEATLEDTQ